MLVNSRQTYLFVATKDIISKLAIRNDCFEVESEYINQSKSKFFNKMVANNLRNEILLIEKDHYAYTVISQTTMKSEETIHLKFEPSTIFVG